MTVKVLITNEQQKVKDKSHDDVVETVANQLFVDQRKDINAIISSEQRKTLLFKLERKVVIHEVPKKKLKGGK